MGLKFTGLVFATVLLVGATGLTPARAQEPNGDSSGKGQALVAPLGPPRAAFGHASEQSATPATSPAEAAGGAADLAKQLANPIASLISFPIQGNADFGMGSKGDGMRTVFNIQPVIPMAINPRWNVISRTIVPLIAQNDVVETSSQSGFGDVLQSFFISPNKSEPFVWGVGPAILIPTATDETLGGGKLGLGPTIVALKQSGGLTVGALSNHIWSTVGDDARSRVSATFIQPFVSYTTPTAWTYTLNTESSYDWVRDQWSIPINVTAAKLIRVGTQPISIGVTVRYWAATTPSGPEGVGFRFTVSPLYPKAKP